MKLLLISCAGVCLAACRGQAQPVRLGTTHTLEQSGALAVLDSLHPPAPLTIVVAYERVWFEELVAPDEVAFEADVFLLRNVAAEALKTGAPREPVPEPGLPPEPGLVSPPQPGLAGSELEPGVRTTTLRLVGTVPPELWNRLGTKILPKLRSGTDLRVGVEFSVTVNASSAGNLAAELRQVLQELGLAELVRIE